MLDNLIALVKENASEAIINNPAIPNEHNDAAISSVAGSIVNTFKSQASSGNINGLMDLFKGGSIANNSISGAISQNAVGELTKKFGIDSAKANSIISSLLPVVMNKFVSKTNDPNDSSFDLKGIMSAVGGGNVGGILNTVKGLFN